MATIPFIFLCFISLQQNVPYAEFQGNGKIDFEKPYKGGYYVCTKFFKAENQEASFVIRAGTASLLHGTTTVSTITNDANCFDFIVFLSSARPGDRILFKLTKVWDTERNKEVFLKKTSFVLKI